MLPQFCSFAIRFTSSLLLELPMISLKKSHITVYETSRRRISFTDIKLQTEICALERFFIFAISKSEKFGRLATETILQRLLLLWILRSRE